MKRIFTMILTMLVLASSNLSAQTGIGTVTPNASAELDVSSTTRGFLPPRMTAVQRNAIPSPAAGLMVFDTDSAAYMLYSGSGWTRIATGTAVGAWSLSGNAGAGANSFIGTTDNQALRIRVNNIPSGQVNHISQNAALGFGALSGITSGIRNTAVGDSAMFSNTTGNVNTAVGAFSLIRNTTGASNSAVGARALLSNVGGSGNTGIGSAALELNTTGIGNTAVGVGSLTNNVSGSSNTAIGANANVSAGNLSNATAIGAGTIVGKSNAVVIGTNADVGIGTTTPSAKLDLVGNLRVADGTQGVGKVLTSDANGLASWQTPSGGGASGWALTGNAGTTAANFIGTTDSRPLSIRVFNQPAGRIDSTSQNTSLGFRSLAAVTSGTNNTSLGFNAMSSTTTGQNNVGVGNLALANNAAGANNAAVGHRALVSNTSGNFNAAHGSGALAGNTIGTNNTAVGAAALQLNTQGSSNTALGYLAMSFNTTGGNNTAVGRTALNGNTTGTQNTAVGFNALTTNTTGSLNTAIGTGSNVASDNLSNATAIGANTIVGKSDAVVIGNNADVGIGTSVPQAKLHVEGSVRLADGTQGVGKVLTSDASGNATWQTPSGGGGGSGWALTGNAGTTAANFIGTTDNRALSFRILNQPSGKIDSTTLSTSFGYRSLAAVTSGRNNTAFGFLAMSSNTTGGSNVAVGTFALASNTVGADNTAVGRGALLVNTTGNANVAFGSSALAGNTNGTNNVAVGGGALQLSTQGNGNTALGYAALESNTIGSRNIAIGQFALSNNTSGGQNIAIGANTMASSTTGTNNITIGTNANVAGADFINAVAIGADASVGKSNAIVLGNSADVGIGTSIPTAKLHVVGTVRVVDGTQAEGKVLTSDANGNATWQTPSGGGGGSSGWTEQGNNVFQTAINAGSVSVGTNNPAPGYKLNVLGTSTRANGARISAVSATDIALNVPLGRSGFGTETPGATVDIRAASTVPVPQLMVTESTDGFARLTLRNTSSNSFTIASRGTAANATSEFNIYFSGTGGNVLSILGNGNATLAGTLTQNSDARLKRAITPLQNSLAKIRQLNGYHYYWRADANRSDDLQIGFLAQEVEALFPELVATDNDGIKSVAYQNLIPVLVEAIKELSFENAQLKGENADVNARLEVLESQVKRMETLMQQFSSLASR